MTEINTEYERLAMPGTRSTSKSGSNAKARSEGQPPDNDGGLLHNYGPNVQIRRAQPAEIGGQPFAAAAVPKATVAVLNQTEKLGLSAFNLRRSAKYRAAKAKRPRDGEDWDMHGCAPEAPVGRDAMQALGAAAPGERGAGDPFLAGSVAVGIIIVNGPTAATRFSAAERVKVVAEVQAGLTWLGNQDPASGVSWHYEINNVSISTSTTATAADDESRWRNPAMGALGQTQNWQGVLNYVSALRTRLGTRWAYCVFFVKGYPLWHFAYASAPRIVMDYANDGWGPDNIDRVFTHETGHIFSCPDEYAAASCSCTTTHGIYNEPNRNCATCAPGGGVACLMKANDWTMCASTRRHLGWGLTSTRVPQGAPVHAVSRAANKLDIFFTDQDGRVMSAAWEPSMPNWWQGFWHIQGGMAAAGAPVTAVSRGANKLDIFVVGTDNRVYTAAWRPDTGWQGWWRIGNISVPHRSQISVVSRSADHLDIFATDVSGRVMSAAWQPSFADGWHGWWHIQGGMAAPGAPVGAAVRGPNQLDIFVVGTDGRVYTAAWQPSFTDGWHGWWRVGNTRFPAGGHVNAVSRSANKLDIFAIANGGETMTAAWEPAFTDGWHGWWHIQGGRGRPGAPIHAVSRSANKLDVFVTGTDRGIFTAAWEPAFTDGWHGWWRLNGGSAALGAAVTAVSRSANKLDAFVVGGDSRIYTAAWEPTFTDWWHGWWPMGV